MENSTREVMTMTKSYKENLLNILEEADTIHDMSNMLALANNGIDDSLINSLVVITIDNLDRICANIQKEVEELRTHIGLLENK